jgi:hypothetical protein
LSANIKARFVVSETYPKIETPCDVFLSSNITDTRQDLFKITVKSNENNGKGFPEESTGPGLSNVILHKRGRF